MLTCRSRNFVPLTASIELPAVAVERVPREWVGWARELRRKVSKEHEGFAKAATALLKPFGPGASLPGERLLRRTAWQWEHNLPRSYRLDCAVDLDRQGRISISETRLQPSKLRVSFWDGEGEPGVSIVRIGITIVPPLMTEWDETQVAIGLHALGRRFERGTRDEASVLGDVRALLHAYRRTSVSGAADFPVAIPCGTWRCTKMSGRDGHPVLTVRTFVN
jgi:hypothetical protein